MTQESLFPITDMAEEVIADSFYMNYPQAMDYAVNRVKSALKNSGNEVRILPVVNVDTDQSFFESVNGKVEKWTFQIGRCRNPEFNILFTTAVHGEESRLWRAGLEVLLRLISSPYAESALLSRGQVTFDLFSDIHGFNNQTRGFVTRGGDAVNAPLLVGRGHDRNPLGLGDRNGEQGRNSIEAISVETRSNHTHYRKVCGPISWVGDHHETNENSHYPDQFFRYGGVMLMAHLYFSRQELALLSQLPRAVTATAKIRRFFNDWMPFSPPLYRDQVLENHPGLRKLRRIRDRIRSMGQRTFEDIHQQVLESFPHVERDFSLDESIWTGGEMFRLPGILLGPDVLAPQGMTSETFQQDLFVRIEQTIAVMEAELVVAGSGGSV